MERPANLIEAARAVVRARDYYADHGSYDPKDFHPEQEGPGFQCFDDWAADILHTALEADGFGLGPIKDEG